MKLYKAMALERAEEIFAAYKNEDKINEFRYDIIDDLTLAYETGYCVARRDAISIINSDGYLDEVAHFVLPKLEAMGDSEV